MENPILLLLEYLLNPKYGFNWDSDYDSFRKRYEYLEENGNIL